MDEIKRKRGRPPKVGSRKCQVNVLFTTEELVRLRDGAGISGESQSEIIRKGVELYLSQIENQYNEEVYYDDYGYEPDDFDDV